VVGLLVIIPLNLYYAEMLLLDKTAQNIPYVFINIFSEKKNSLTLKGSINLIWEWGLRIEALIFLVLSPEN